ncbi:hypothetical protein [Methylosinus sp. Sm6]|uniref:hypothetical protein n=1 Tax=Methylosinus sp. Sm6 TaxID=2866948 RepID=UPI001C999A3B|nr:hypothetical protein [Methylosinus sp. Sm6]MBY6242853.1 hypothetical protein [Methylosinus sp. Sm6]
MRRSKEANPAISPSAASGSLIGMIDYMLPEVGEISPLAEYFLRMARETLVEAVRDVDERRGG